MKTAGRKGLYLYYNRSTELEKPVSPDGSQLFHVNRNLETPNKNYDNNLNRDECLSFPSFSNKTIISIYERKPKQIHSMSLEGIALFFFLPYLIHQNQTCFNATISFSRCF